MYTTEYAIEKLHEAAKKLGRTPTRDEMDKLVGFPSANVYKKHFGSWRNAITNCGLPPRRKMRNLPIRRFPKRKLRFFVLDRDKFTCQYCGRGPRDGAVLEVDHVKSHWSGGKTTEENLITSCWECNIGKRVRELKTDIKEYWLDDYSNKDFNMSY